MTHLFGKTLIASLMDGHGMADHAGEGLAGGEPYAGAPLALGEGDSWELRFPEPRPVRFIVVENDTPVDRPDAPIEIGLLEQGGAWRVIHSGDASFGDAENGLPLVIDLGPGRLISALRLSGAAGLSLGQIRLIGPKAPEPGFRFVATRLDGLCQRLTTLLNAVILAELTGRDFGFIWYSAGLPEIDRQANSDLDLLFEREFSDRHLVDFLSLKPGMPNYYHRPHTKAQFDWLMAAAADHGVFQVDRPGKLESIFPHLADRIDGDTNRRAFESLGFTASARAAIDLARQINLPEGAVGLHLRGGDIVHGTHSNHGGYLHKAVSIFEVEEIVERVRQSGKPLVIVGQEEDMIDTMVDRHEHVSSVHHHIADRGFDPVQSVLFDAVVLSRMTRIWAANSAVSRLSMKIGNVPMTDVEKAALLPGPSAFYDPPFDDPRYGGISDNYKAYSAIKTVWTQPVESWGRPHLLAMQYANRLRPGIQFIHLLLGAIRAKTGRMDIAEDRMRDVLTLPPIFEGTDVTANYLLSHDPPAPQAVIACFAEADARAHPHAYLVHALCRAFHAGDAEARAHVRHVLDGETGIRLRPSLVTDIERLIFGKRDPDRFEDRIVWLR